MPQEQIPEYYYHAGCGTDGAIEWSTLTHETSEAAEAEAREMAARTGTRGVVEYWSRDHGPEPGDCEAVEGADWLP